MNKLKRVIIDTDAGADDLFAIALALLAPNIIIQKIICSYGNFDVEESYKKIKYFVENKVKVHKGEKKSFVISTLSFRDNNSF